MECMAMVHFILLDLMTAFPTLMIKPMMQLIFNSFKFYGPT